MEEHTPTDEPTTQEYDITAAINSMSQHQQFEMLMRAFDIYKERGEVRGELWAQFSPDDSIGHLRSKLARVEAAWSKIAKGDGSDAVREAIIDDALDIVNYAVFTVRHIEGIKL